MKSFCVIGLSKFGAMLAETLAHEKYQVMVIDQDVEAVEALADITVNAVVGDPTNEKVLQQAGVRNFDCVIVCFDDNLNDSILTTVLLKEMGIKQVVVKVNSELNKRVLEKVGADMVIFPEQDMGERLAHVLMTENVLEYFEFSDKYTIVSMLVPESWLGKTIVEADIRRKYQVTVIAVQRKNGEVAVSPHPETVFETGDVVSMIGTREQLDKLMKRVK